MSKSINVPAAAVALAEIATKEAMFNYLETKDIPPMSDTDETDPVEVATLVLAVDKASSQADFATCVMNVTLGEGDPLSGSTLTDALAAAFPQASISQRHGPHFLSLARKNKLPKLRGNIKNIPHAKRRRVAVPAQASAPTPKPAPAPAVVKEPTVSQADLEALSRRELVKAAKAANVQANGKSAVIIQRMLDAGV
jgi:hypothetical protein